MDGRGDKEARRCGDGLCWRTDLEASHADIGIAGGRNEALLFSNGKIVGKLKGDSIAEQFIQKIRELG